MKQLSLIILFLAIGWQINAQQVEGCATPPVKSEWLTEYQQNPAAYPRSSEILYVPITIHLVGTDVGNGYFSIESLLDAFCTLQSDFVDSEIQFFIEGDIRYIDNSTYYNHTFGEGAEMMYFHNIPNTINCYIVSDPAGACGYFSPGQDGVALAKSCMGVNDHTWAHEIGHFLSLPHTFLGWEGTDYDYSSPTPNFVNNFPVERLDGSNCNQAAGGFCDTEPDYLSYRWPCNGEQLSNQPQQDPEGEEFRSDGTLFMSYANDNCSSRFSGEQTGAMRANLLGPRASFLYNQNPPQPLDPSIATLVSPVNDELITEVGSLELSWEAIPDAVGYLVDLDLMLPNGSAYNFGNYHTSTNSYVVTGLVSDKAWRWSVRAYNLNDGCTTYSDFEQFTTGNFLTATQEVEGLSALSLFPVPQSAGNQVQLSWSMVESKDLQLRIINLTGQTLYTERFFSPAGKNSKQINTNDLAAGVYVLALETENGRSFKRLVLK